MELEIEKYNGMKQKSTTTSYPILEYKITLSNTNLLLVKKWKMGVE